MAHDQEQPELWGGDHGVSFVRGRVPELAGGGALGHGHHRPARQCHGEDPVLPGVVSLRDILRRALQQADNYAERLSPGGPGHRQASLRGQHSHTGEDGGHHRHRGRRSDQPRLQEHDLPDDKRLSGRTAGHEPHTGRGPWYTGHVFKVAT